ncbi:MAG: hypothetical protein KAU24_02540 [Candidatus Aenigmarchaeota archaeon]|nr:hypothetical protein [Candidatus Aenigmarchaeota archaeon]
MMFFRKKPKSGKFVAMPINMSFPGLKPEEIKEALKTVDGLKIPENSKAKGGRYLFDFNKIKEHLPEKKKPSLKEYFWLADLGVSLLLDPERNYTTPLQLFEENPPFFTLENKRVMIPENILFDEIYDGFCKEELEKYVTKGDIVDGYMRASRFLFVPFLARAINKGFVEGTYIDIIG